MASQALAPGAAIERALTLCDPRVYLQWCWCWFWHVAAHTLDRYAAIYQHSATDHSGTVLPYVVDIVLPVIIFDVVVVAKCLPVSLAHKKRVTHPEGTSHHTAASYVCELKIAEVR